MVRQRVHGVGIAALATLALAGCFKTEGIRLKDGRELASLNEGGTGAKSVTVSWTANRERGVNSAGGGYRVYYSRSGTFDAATPSVTVTNAGAATPTSARIAGLASGTYSFRVVAFSAANPTGSVGTQTTVVVP